MPRWQAIESALLAASATEYERQELSRRAERRRMAGMAATLSGRLTLAATASRPTLRKCWLRRARRCTPECGSENSTKDLLEAVLPATVSVVECVSRDTLNVVVV
jgi:hypothetical protein